jgi:uncharacterized heparinase superfamily protein
MAELTSAEKGLAGSVRRLNGRVVRIRDKARGRSFRYLAWKGFDRGRKKARSKVPESVLYRRARLEADAIAARAGGSLRSHFLSVSAGRFLWEQDDVPKIIERCVEHDPEYVAGLRQRAEEVRQHRVNVLSVGTMDLGRHIDWQKDYRSGLRWEKVPSGNLSILDLGRRSDVRIVWELNRLHFLVDLAKAYRATDDEDLVGAAVELIEDWDKQNPVGVGVNWTCPMEAAIRAVNLIWTLVLVMPSPSLSEPFLRRAVEMLLEHGIYIRRNLEYSDVRGNHYLSDLVGLAWIGTFLAGSGLASGWVRFARPRLEQEVDHQVYDDGATHEGSIPYHRLVTELFLDTGLLLARNGVAMSDGFWSRVEKMLDFVAAYTKPDGTCPMFGDTDDGRLHVLGRQPINDHRYLLAIGGVAMDRPDLSAAAGGPFEEATWILGSRGSVVTRGHGGAEPGASRAFPAGGWFFLRSQGAYVAVDCGDVGLRGQGGHGHCDILSIEAAVGGTTLIVDRGNPHYTSDAVLRRDAIVASSHNTVTVDDVDYAVVVPHDIAMVRPTPGRVLRWEVTPEHAVFEGEHDGYAALGIRHQRRIELVHQTSSIEIRDRILGQGRHSLRARFHLAEGVAARPCGNSCELSSASGILGRLTGGDTEVGNWTVRDTTIYPSYGVAVPASCAEWEAVIDLPATVNFRLEPCAHRRSH